jgi:hypothetical protein
MDFFVGTMANTYCIQPTPIMQYESELKLEAQRLAEDCNNDKLLDGLEEEWVHVLLPIVFYRFFPEREEKYARSRHHHW